MRSTLRGSTRCARISQLIHWHACRVAFIGIAACAIGSACTIVDKQGPRLETQLEPLATRIPGLVASSKYAIYYGQSYAPEVISALLTYQMVIVHPTNSVALTPAIVAQLQAAGVKVIAYISIGEDSGASPIVGNSDGPVKYVGGATGYNATSIVPSGATAASFYVDQMWNGTAYISDGVPDKNPNFNSYYILPNGDWRWVLNEQRIGGVPGTSLPTRSVAGLKQLAGVRISDTDADRTHNFGFDGFFLDTLDTAGPYLNVVGYYSWAAPEVQQTVAFINTTYPTKINIANRGAFFHNPNIVNPTYNIRPHDYTIRPSINAMMFESYTLDSDAANPGLSPYLSVNRNNYAQKVSAEANRPDGFTVLALDYGVNRAAPLLAQAITEARIMNGWLQHTTPNAALDIIGAATTTPADTAAPVWDSTAAASDVSSSGVNAELYFPRSWINNPSYIDLFFYGDNPAIGGAVTDLYPDGALTTGAATRSFIYKLQ
jgi:hypothetical protein